MEAWDIIETKDHIIYKRGRFSLDLPKGKELSFTLTWNKHKITSSFSYRKDGMECFFSDHVVYLKPYVREGYTVFGVTFHTNLATLYRQIYVLHDVDVILLREEMVAEEKKDIFHDFSLEGGFDLQRFYEGGVLGSMENQDFLSITPIKGMEFTDAGILRTFGTSSKEMVTVLEFEKKGEKKEKCYELLEKGVELLHRRETIDFVPHEKVEYSPVEVILSEEKIVLHGNLKKEEQHCAYLVTESLKEEIIKTDYTHDDVSIKPVYKGDFKIVYYKKNIVTGAQMRKGIIAYGFFGEEIKITNQSGEEIYIPRLHGIEFKKALAESRIIEVKLEHYSPTYSYMHAKGKEEGCTEKIRRIEAFQIFLYEGETSVEVEINDRIFGNIFNGSWEIK